MVDVRWGVQGAAPTGGGPILKILSGYVSYNQPLPVTFDDPVWVIVASHSPDSPWGPLHWAQEHGATLPIAGTEVVVGVDDQGMPHLLRWYGPHS